MEVGLGVRSTACTSCSLSCSRENYVRSQRVGVTVMEAMNQSPAEVEAAQREVCVRYEVKPVPAPASLKVGIARNVREGLLPINGLRHQPEDDTTGWYVWAGGEASQDPEFFVPVHVEHLTEWFPDVIPYLQLPPGYRFRIAPGHEDVWRDPALLTPAR